ncbi:MAG: efflux RND transporter periplasmic adaptor subunit [Gemmobacter sp.]|nr:efflux RND transporter periplasmic adaptor subunit [Gemmobacter sp.]
MLKAILKQGILGLLVLAAGLMVWIWYVPSSRPILEGYGLLSRLQALGVPLPQEQPAAAAPQGRGGPGAPGAATVVAAAPTERLVNDRLSAIGNGQALHSVTVLPEVGGRIADLLVTSGERVTKGQVIARLDDEAERIAVERATLVLDDARDRSDRITRLQSSGVAADIQIREADLALRQAELQLRQAEFDLARRAIRAPISGSTGILNAEIGRQVTTATEITRIDDRSAIVVEFHVPERLVGLIKSGDKLQAQPLALTGTDLEGTISAIDNRVDPASRTLLVQARLDNGDDSLRAGMSFAITIVLPGEAVPSVDPLSVQWGTEGAFVWVVREGRAQRLPIRIVQRSADAVLVRAAFQPGDLVVIEGVQALRPGAEVQVKGTSQSGDAGAARPVVTPAKL